jgi:hypothetical protein
MEGLLVQFYHKPILQELNAPKIKSFKVREGSRLLSWFRASRNA